MEGQQECEKPNEKSVQLLLSCHEVTSTFGYRIKTDLKSLFLDPKLIID